MPCSECEATRMEFLRLRRSVLLFARTLNQFESDRLDEVDANRPPGAVSMKALRAEIERDAGLTLSDPFEKPEVRRGARG